jgi:hypothetical protein
MLAAIPPYWKSLRILLISLTAVVGGCRHSSPPSGPSPPENGADLLRENRSGTREEPVMRPKSHCDRDRLIRTMVGMELRNITIALATAVLALTPATALAKQGDDDRRGDDRRVEDTRGGGRDDDETRVTGRCTGRSTAKFKVKPDDGRLEAEFEVDQNRNGVTWRVRLRRGGRTLVSTRATTRAPSGSFSVERKIAAGSGKITATATSPSGEVCRATI